MLGIGLPELLLILVLLVVCFRPDQLADLARTAGAVAGRLWRMSQELREEVERGLADVPRWEGGEERSTVSRPAQLPDASREERGL